MGNLNDEDRQLLKEIHECLIGDLDRQGFIGETKGRIEKLEGDIKRFKNYIAFVAVPLGGIVAERLIHVITGMGA